MGASSAPRRGAQAGYPRGAPLQFACGGADDALFDAVANPQYRREPKSSQVVELMTAVVTRVEDSVLPAYRARTEALGVSDQAAYDKLRGLEAGLSWPTRPRKSPR